MNVFNRDTDIHYKLVSKYYGNARAERSEVLLINHINEGLLVLDKLESPLICHKAYCLHPLLQSNADLFSMLSNKPDLLKDCDVSAVILAMEYRHQLNRYSSRVTIKSSSMKLMKDLKQVMQLTPYLRHVAMADKVQNRKDFEKYHKGTHPRSDALDNYFKTWLIRILDITEVQYKHLIKGL